MNWELVELSEVDTADWVDPVGHTPVWSSPGFRRVTEELPQHPVVNLLGVRAGKPVLMAPSCAPNGPAACCSTTCPR